VGEGPDPQSEETFARSRVHCALGNQDEHAQLRAMFRELLAIRHEEPALRPGAARITVQSDASARWIAMRLDAPGARSLLALFNLATSEHTVPLGGERDGRWRARFSTSGALVDDALAGGSAVALPPLSASLFYQENV